MTRFSFSRFFLVVAVVLFVIAALGAFAVFSGPSAVGFTAGGLAALALAHLLP